MDYLMGVDRRSSLPMLLIGLTGCNQTAPEPAPVVSGAPKVSSPPTGIPTKAATAKGEGSTTLTTPDRAVDPKSLVDVVKEEVQGGESTQGPTPFNYLWMPTKTELIKDEPLKATIPAGLNSIAGNIPPSNPTHKGAL